MIRVKNVSKKIENHAIFSNVNFEILPGEILAIQGESGVGKSSLLNIIGLLDSDYTGMILINNLSINEISKKRQQELVRYQISYLFQDYALIVDETVKFNLQLALEYTPLTKKEKKLMILKSLENYGLERLLDQPIYTLSGGEQQRISLIRTLLKPGNIILADEPTGNLDKKNTEIIMTFLKKQAQSGKTIIIVTHDEFIANQCDKIYWLKKE